MDEHFVRLFDAGSRAEAEELLVGRRNDTASIKIVIEPLMTAAAGGGVLNYSHGEMDPYGYFRFIGNFLQPATCIGRYLQVPKAPHCRR